MIDQIASDRALRRHGIPLCLHVPIAARDEAAITTYVGKIRATLSGRGRRAFLVNAYPPAARDAAYPIFEHPSAAVLHRPEQVWVDIGYSGYRRAYAKAFPNEPIGEAVLSHAMNRRMAALKGFTFVRITLTSREANSSSAFAEGKGVALHGEPHQAAANRARGNFVEYGDLTDLMLMLDIMLGGGFMDAVNEGQKLIRLKG